MVSFLPCKCTINSMKLNAIIMTYVSVVNFESDWLHLSVAQPLPNFSITCHQTLAGWVGDKTIGCPSSKVTSIT